MYTTTLLTQTDTRQLSKINPAGDDVMPPSGGLHPNYQYKFGDLGDVQVEGTIVKTKFTDVCYDEEGFINALDFQRGRIFQYSDEGDLVSVFGGIGNQAGTFQSPSAVEMMGHDILVLDSGKNNLTVFGRTAFGEEVQEALIAHRRGEYTQVKAQWESILGRAGHYSLALTASAKPIMSRAITGRRWNISSADRIGKIMARPIKWCATACSGWRCRGCVC